MGVPAYLAVLGERSALAWVLRTRTMAFPEHRRSEASKLQVGDRLFLYATRGCFHNPGRDRGRVMGLATVASPTARNDHPVRFGDREFPHECRLTLAGLTAPLTGLALAPLVDRLEAFPDPASWSVRMRRALVPLSAHDATLIDRLLGPLLDPADHHISAYEALVPSIERTSARHGAASSARLG